MKSRIFQSVVPILLVIAFTPALCRAQAEINPDHFDSVSNAATLENKVTSRQNPSRAYGSFFLPVDVTCAGIKLHPGYYSLSVRQLGKRNVVRLAPMVNGVGAQALEVTATPRWNLEARSELLVGRINQRRTLRAISLEEAGVTLILETGKEAVVSMDAELIPISSSANGAVPASGN